MPGILKNDFLEIIDTFYESVVRNVGK